MKYRNTIIYIHFEGGKLWCDGVQKRTSGKHVTQQAKDVLDAIQVYYDGTMPEITKGYFYPNNADGLPYGHFEPKKEFRQQQKLVKKPYWIKERHNPQLGVYYVKCGQMSRTAAKRAERALYGSNIMHPFNTEQEYLAEIQRLLDAGERIQ